MIRRIAIPPLPAINHKRCVLFAADNSSQNTVISRPATINADTKASIKSEIGCNKNAFNTPEINEALPIQGYS